MWAESLRFFFSFTKINKMIILPNCDQNNETLIESVSALIQKNRAWIMKKRKISLALAKIQHLKISSHTIFYFF